MIIVFALFLLTLLVLLLMDSITRYARALRETADWFVQLWAESLGKGVLLTGEVPRLDALAVGAAVTSTNYTHRGGRTTMA